METTNEAMTVQCDIVFVGASTPNLLAASALLERIDSITIRILDMPSHRPVAAQPFMTVISPEAWSALKELNARFANLVHRRKLFMNEEGSATREKGSLDESRWLMADRFYELLRQSFPEQVICRADGIDQIQEMTDRVLIRMQDGACYESKLLISDAGACSCIITTPSCFVEVNVTTPKRPSFSLKERRTSAMYLNSVPSDSDVDVFSCLVPSDIITSQNAQDVLCKIPFFGEVLSEVEWLSVVQRSLTATPMESLTPARGRTARSGEMSAALPYTSPLKAEFEFEEVLHLKRAILNKGLTAAAISDWKRRQTASSTTQHLKHKTSSPLELIPSSSEDITHDTQRSHDTNDMDRLTGIRIESGALGKPLVCKDLKPYVALALID